MRYNPKKLLSAILLAALLVSAFAAFPLTAAAAEPALTVRAESNLFPEAVSSYYDLSEYEDENGDVFVTVDFRLLAQDKYLVAVDIDSLTWDPAVLEWSMEANRCYGINGLFPFAWQSGCGAGIARQTSSNRVVGNYSSVSPAAYAYSKSGEAVTVVRAVFKVLDRTAGTTIVTCNIDSIALSDETDSPSAQYRIATGGEIDREALSLAEVSAAVYPKVQKRIVYGDVNNDSSVTVEDATLLQEQLAEYTAADGTPLLDLSCVKVFARCDANRDGRITIGDVTAIQRIIAELS